MVPFPCSRHSFSPKTTLALPLKSFETDTKFPEFADKKKQSLIVTFSKTMWEFLKVH